MLSSYLKYALLFLSLSYGIVAVSAIPHDRGVVVDVTLSAPSGKGIKATQILKYGTVLDQLKTEAFTVTKDGKPVPFTGIRVSLSPMLTDSASVHIPAGETVQVVHSVGDRYDFASAGPGEFTFTPNVLLMEVLVDGNSDRIHTVVPEDAIQYQPVTIDISQVDSVDVSDGFSSLGKRATNKCSDPVKKKFIDSSYMEAKELAVVAGKYVKDRGDDDALFRSYFGNNSNGPRVETVLDRSAKENLDQRTLDCADPYTQCDGNVIAYTVLLPTTPIYFCDIFFDWDDTALLCKTVKPEDRHTRGGVMLHELTHAVGGTMDDGYGCAFDRSLPDYKKIRNADNYNCFAESVYKYKC